MHRFVTAGIHVNSSQAIARQLLGKQVPVTTNTHATTEELFSVWSVLSGYKNAKEDSSIQLQDGGQQAMA
jgi:hypothetical protein